MAARAYTADDVTLVRRHVHRYACDTDVPAKDCVMGCARQADQILRDLARAGRIAHPVNPEQVCQRRGCRQTVRSSRLFCTACQGLTAGEAAELADRTAADTTYRRYLDAAEVA